VFIHLPGQMLVAAARVHAIKINQFRLIDRIAVLDHVQVADVVGVVAGAAFEGVLDAIVFMLHGRCR